MWLPVRFLPFSDDAFINVYIQLYILSPQTTAEISQTLLEYVGIVAIMLVIVDNIRLFTVSLIFFDLSIISAPTPISAALRKIRGESNSDTILLSIVSFSEIRVTARAYNINFYWVPIDNPLTTIFQLRRSSDLRLI